MVEYFNVFATVFYAVMLVSSTSGILTTEVPKHFQSVTSLRSPPSGYLPTTNTASPKLSQHGVFVNRGLDNGLEDVGTPGSGGFTGRQPQAGYSYLRPLSIDLKLPSKDQRIQSITDRQRSQKGTGIDGETTTPRTIARASVDRSSRLRAEVEHRPQAPQRQRSSSSYRVVEERDEYLTDDSARAGLVDRGKYDATKPHRDSQDVTTLIKALDHFLSGILNDHGHNSELHPPPNPVLALLLSRYGRYVLGARNPRVYAHMAVNNIHNNKPFGSYKVECEEVPAYVRR